MNKKNTAVVTMAHQGAVLSFNGSRYEDWANCFCSGDNVDDVSGEEDDLARAQEMLRVIESKPKIKFVIDLENNGDEIPMPVEEYKAQIRDFINGLTSK